MSPSKPIPNYFEIELAAASLEAIAASNGHHSASSSATDDGALLAMLIRWDEFWATDHKAEEWLWAPVIAAKRSTALFAPGGTGKSLVSLHIAASVALSGKHVLYLDYEMTEDDLADRLEDMGYDESSDLSTLHYALLPSLPGLDQAEGGRAVVRMAELVDAELVIIDTFGRAVHGDENEADTVRAWYRWTGLHLKHAERAFLRVDHAGKDVTKGQRGTSAKNDDVDVVWELKVVEDGYQLISRKRRMGWVPETVHLAQSASPLRFTVSNLPGWPAGTQEAIELLDRLGIATEMSHHKAGPLVRQAGFKISNQVLRAAIRARREAFDGSQISLDQLVDKGVNNVVRVGPESFRPNVSESWAGNDSAQPSAQPPKTASDLRASGIPAHCGPGSESIWAAGAISIDGPGPGPAPNPAVDALLGEDWTPPIEPTEEQT